MEQTKLTEAGQKLGETHMFFVHGLDGLDEISVTGPTYVCEVKDGDLKEYEIFGPGITAIGLHPNERQRWYAPESLQFGQGVRFDAMKAPHAAVARRAPPRQSSAPRLSVECRVLLLSKKA